MGISLLDAPHVDMEVNAFGMGDVMAVPGVKQVVDAVVKVRWGGGSGGGGVHGWDTVVVVCVVAMFTC